jgi:hypothetical protein
MDAKTRKTWISIAVAIVIIVVVLGITLIGSAVFFVRRHVNAEFTSAEVATQEIERERARFAGQEPLIELTEHEEPIIHRRAAASPGELQTLRVVAFDPRARKLVHVSIPFWILRLAPSGRIRLNEQNIDLDSDRLHLTVDDLERAGPGLILDARRRRDGGQVLIWAE